MRVAIDARPLVSLPYTGVAVTSRELLPRLFSQAPDSTFQLFCVSWRSIPSELLSWQKQFPNLELRVKKIPGRLFDGAVRFTGFGKQIGKSSDVLLSPNINIAGSTCPRVLVMHDLSFVRFPELLTVGQKFWHWLMAPKIQAKRADAIIVPSHATKEDLVRLWGIAESKIFVIPWGSPIVKRRAAKNNGVPRILSIGAIEPRKNFPTLVRAFAMLKTKDVRLTIAGPKGQGWQELQKTIRDLGEDSRVSVRGFVSEEEKERLFEEASVFVYPSFLEGFGLPPLEAMAWGIPTIASNRSSLPEVVGDAGILVDPWKAEEIAAAIDAVLEDQKFAAELSQRGIKRAETFSWEKAAAETLRLLNGVVKNRA